MEMQVKTNFKILSLPPVVLEQIRLCSLIPQQKLRMAQIEWIARRLLWLQKREYHGVRPRRGHSQQIPRLNPTLRLQVTNLLCTSKVRPPRRQQAQLPSSMLPPNVQKPASQLTAKDPPQSRSGSSSASSQPKSLSQSKHASLSKTPATSYPTSKHTSPVSAAGDPSSPSNPCKALGFTNADRNSSDTSRTTPPSSRIWH